MPENLVVEAKIPEKKDAQGNVTQPQLGPVSITVQTGKNVEELIQMFGGEAVKTNAEANWVVTLQSNMRGGLKKGETQSALQARLGGAKMGVAQKGIKIDPVQAYLAQFASATPEQQKAMLAELQARAAKK